MSARHQLPRPLRWLSLPSGLLLATACQDLIGADFSSAHPHVARVAGSGGNPPSAMTGGRFGTGAEEGAGADSAAGGGSAGKSLKDGSGGVRGGAEPPSSPGASGQGTGGAASGGAGSAGAASDGGGMSQAGKGGEGGGMCEGIQDCPSSDPCMSTACVSGECQSRPTCPDPAETACIATCVATSLGGAACGVVAPDGDGDDHGDASCSRGDDCNDANPDVHPDAKEVCDGLDGNCNGLSDVNELGLGGQNLLVPTFGDETSVIDTATVWSPRARAFAVVWAEELPLARVRMNFLRLDGTWRFADHLAVNDAQEGAGAPSVAAAQDYLGVAWIDSRAAAPGVYFRRFQAASGGGEEPVLLSGSGTNPLVGAPDSHPLRSHRPQIVAHADGDWSVFWIAEVSPGADQVYGAHRFPTSVITGPHPVGEPGGQREHLRAAIVGDSVAVVWSNRPASGAFSVVEWALLGPSFESRLLSNQERLSKTANNAASATDPVVSGSEAGVHVAFRFRYAVDDEPVESLHVVRRRKSDGGYYCDREHVGEFYPTGSASNGEGLILTGYRTTVAGGRELLLAGYDASCSVTSTPILIDTEPQESDNNAGPLLQPFMGPSSSGFGLLWSRNDYDGISISGRFVGKNLCD